MLVSKYPRKSAIVTATLTMVPWLRWGRERYETKRNLFGQKDEVDARKILNDEDYQIWLLHNFFKMEILKQNNASVAAM